jgi:hypothetical protein
LSNRWTLVYDVVIEIFWKRCYVTKDHLSSRVGRSHEKWALSRNLTESRQA